MSDLDMPEMDGFEAARLIRKESAVPIIMLTARDDDAAEDDPDAFRAYFDDMVENRLEDNATVQLLIELDRRPLPPPPNPTPHWPTRFAASCTCGRRPSRWQIA
mgnify:CR=1 FL=1